MDVRSKILYSQEAPGEKEGANGIFVLEGKVNGQTHRVLIQELRAIDLRFGEPLLSLAARKNSLEAKAAFVCMPVGVSGESILLALKLGLIPIEGSGSEDGLRAHLGQPMVVRHVQVQSWALVLLVPPAAGKGFTFDGTSPDLFFREKPIRNWLCRESQKLIQKAESDCLISVQYKLQHPVVFHSQGKALEATGLDAWFECRILNRVRTLRVGLEGVRYNPRLGKLLAAANPSGKRAGNPTGPAQDETPLAGRSPSPRPQLLIYHPVAASADSGMPDLNREILSMNVSTKFE
ncbi:MAG: hypothetical protein JWO30_2420 [Fibrobacteres bacterium]|nr:hypothetical protein [Fibrobacterota bacterium]